MSAKLEWQRASGAVAVLILALVALVGLPVRAAEPEPTLVLDELVTEALRNSPVIAAKQAMLTVAERRVPQAGAWPEPMFSIGVRNMGLPLSVGTDPMSLLDISIAQQFPFPGKTGLREDVARRQAERAGADIAQARLDLVGRLKSAYFDLYDTYRAIEVTIEIRKLLQEVAKIAASRYGVGQVSQNDVLKARIEIAKMTDDLIMLEGRKDALKGSINALLNRPPLAPLGRPAAPAQAVPVFVAEELGRRVQERSPLLQGADVDILRARAAIDLARKEYLPDFTLMGGYMHRGSLGGGWELSLSVNLPIFFRSRQDQMVLESQAMLQQSQRSKEATAQDLLAMLRGALAMVQTASRQEDLYRTVLLPQARLAVQSAMISYTVGKIDFLMLFDTFVLVKTYERQYTTVVSAANKALAQIEVLAGGPLEPTVIRSETP